ncbi:hypothetical protein MX003_03550 [Streptococcus uberis]|uniref:Sigma-70 family RNA polymerase sigma factor n=1 Tax=Streptococcus uberis TaxID=1349 RepID=A0A6L6G7G7_STRUB|nr:hypothetical protein [Streptococcus uberis]MCK1236779.1 hypothetical protein [Streptococcus uberis]MTB98507.1 hypothetical protein [Streptococcus uberis]MTC84366.1 hypothetical protein [Streptococcus uberis]MTC86721.1 hypothetical protein [Streptococcus uberis]MTD01158.1 hypothetical protein [Streptococcus uberis]
MDKVKKRRNEKIKVAAENENWDEVLRLLDQEYENSLRKDRSYGLLSTNFLYNKENAFQELEDYICSSFNPLDYLIMKELMEKLYNEIFKLTEFDFKIIIGYFFEEKNKSQLARELEVDNKTISNHLNKIYLILKEKLKDYY